MQSINIEKKPEPAALALKDLRSGKWYIGVDGYGAETLLYVAARYLERPLPLLDETNSLPVPDGCVLIDFNNQFIVQGYVSSYVRFYEASVTIEARRLES